MKNMTLKEITAACKGTYFGNPDFLQKEVAGVAIDSRKIKTDFLFIPIKGARVDGHDFITSVISAGALCSLSEIELPEADFSYILVDSCLQALKDLAEHYRSSLNIKVVGITGSVGKTSTKEMVASVLSQKYNVLKTQGNYNNEIGLPLTIFNITDEHEIAVLEMGINQFGEMTRLSKIAKPDVALITNIGLSHLEFLKSREGVLQAKSEIFTFLSPEGTVVLNYDDTMLSKLPNINGKQPVFFGCSDESHIHATDIQPNGLRGTNCKISLASGNTIEAKISIPGSHMVPNALAGAAIGELFGLTSTQIEDGISSLVPVSGRTNIIETDSLTIIDDCYNASPVSMNSSLDILSTVETRKIAILGDMGELGDAEDELHYGVGIHAAYNHIDIICCVGPLSLETYTGAEKSIAREPHLKHCKAIYFNTKKELLANLPQLLNKEDTVLVKASNFMRFSEVVELLKNTKL